MCEVTGYGWELEQAVVHVDTEHPKQPQWVTSGAMQAMEELGHFQLQGIVYRSLCHFVFLCDQRVFIMLRREVMAADEWRHVNEPQDLAMVSLCIHCL
jgi:hypothetical protein